MKTTTSNTKKKPQGGTVLDAVTSQPVKVAKLPKAAKGGTLALVPQAGPVARLDTVQMAAAIKADMLAYETLTRASAFMALRVGLRLVLVRDQGKHGELGAFIGQHLKGFSRRTLTNYMHVADAMAKDMGLLKDGALTNASAVEPVIDGNLESLADPKGKPKGMLAKVSAWVNGRGLTDIYRAIEAEATDRATPPTGKRSKVSDDELRAQALAEAKAMLDSLALWHTGKGWQNLEAEDLERLREIASDVAEQVPAFAASLRATKKK